MSLKSRFIFLIASAVEYYLFWVDKGWDHFVLATVLWCMAIIEIVPVKEREIDEWETENL